MSDYLFIDTTKARSAARNLRTQSAAGVDHAGSIGRACALADLVDISSTRLVVVAEALAELATVLEERCDAAESGGLLPYRTTSLPLAGITESLYGYAPPTVGQLFPTIGPPTTRIDVPESLDRVDRAHDDERHLVDPIISWFRPVIEQPVVSPLDRWNDIEDRFGDAWDAVESVGGELGDQLSEVDWSVAERLADRMQDALTNPLVIAGTAAGLPLLPMEVASHYGIIAVDFNGAGPAYTRAGDGEQHLGISVPTAMPIGPPSLIPTITFTPTGDVPESGFNVNAIICDVVCIGGTIGEDLSAKPTVGAGPPGGGVDVTYTRWFDLPWGGDD